MVGLFLFDVARGGLDLAIALGPPLISVFVVKLIVAHVAELFLSLH